MHVPSPEDLTIFHHGCGWRSDELTVDEVRELGVPVYCEHCRKADGVRYVKFHSRERVQAYKIVGIPLWLRKTGPNQYEWSPESSQ